jgi:CDP-diacylglycerol--serine O-phosphatidyltransferase
MDDSDLDSNEQRRGIYLLPNLFTTGALFCGFYAIISAINAHTSQRFETFETAAIAVFIAMVLDGLDGRVARLTHTESAFGAEYDSLSDMVSFGLAPALIMYEWSLHSLGKLGWLAAFVYTAAAALRLARFNTQISTGSKAYFQGLPSPAAAALLAGFLWVAYDYRIIGAHVNIATLFLTVLAGVLMVSNVRYHSFKNFNLRGRIPFVAALLIVLVFVLVSLDPAQVLFFILLAYVISGPLLTLTHLRQRRLERKENQEKES